LDPAFRFATYSEFEEHTTCITRVSYCIGVDPVKTTRAQLNSSPVMTRRIRPGLLITAVNEHAPPWASSRARRATRAVVHVDYPPGSSTQFRCHCWKHFQASGVVDGAQAATRELLAASQRVEVEQCLRGVV
jgi:hypothetical protein